MERENKHPPSETASAPRLAVLGYNRLGPRLSSGQVADIHAHFASCNPLPGYISGRLDGLPAQPFTLQECAELSLWACYSPHDTLSAPHLLEAAMAPDILAAVHGWLQAEPVIYSVNAFWTFPRVGIRGTQIFHRDFDEERFVAVFFYLTDFTADDGAQRYVIGSHDAARFERACLHYGTLPLEAYHRHKDRAVHSSLERDFPIATLAGPAGTCVLLLPGGFHCGGLPVKNRLLAWVRYGTCANSAYVADRIFPVAVEGREPMDITRLILK